MGQEQGQQASCISVVIVSYNVADLLLQCLTSVYAAQSTFDLEVWVVDNASTDNTVQAVQTHFPQVKLIASSENLGFAKANNLAIAQCTGQAILLLNPDTILPEDAFELSYQLLQSDETIGALGYRMVDATGRYLPESKRGLPTPLTAFYKLSGLAGLFPKSAQFGRYYLGNLSASEPQWVEVLSGACMFYRAAILKQLGGFESSYFMYGEDIDLSYSTTQLGYKLRYSPEITIIHYKGESTQRESLKFVKRFYEAMLIFYQRHFKHQFPAWLGAFITVGIWFRATLAGTLRMGKVLGPALLDGLLLYVAMFVLKTYWENEVKTGPGYYPDSFMQAIVPGYIAIWVTTMFFAGVYDHRWRAGAIVRGLAIGIILISGITNFIDDIRFSKALILLGGLAGMLLLPLWRLLFLAIKGQTPAEGPTNNKWLLATPEPSVQAQLQSHLGQLSAGTLVTGIDPTMAKGLGIRHWVLPYPALSFKQIIQFWQQSHVLGLTASLLTSQPEVWGLHRYLAKETNKDKVPRLATLAGKRDKRLFDLLICGLLIAGLPFAVILTLTRPNPWLKTWLAWLPVLFGIKTWVGIAGYKRAGVFTFTDGLAQDMVPKASSLYAQDYQPWLDMAHLWQRWLPKTTR